MPSFGDAPIFLFWATFFHVLRPFQRATKQGDSLASSGAGFQPEPPTFVTAQCTAH
jgi:hypothetical protein